MAAAWRRAFPAARELARGVEPAHVHAVDADVGPVGLADGGAEEAVEVRGDPEPGREEHDGLAAGQLLLCLEQGEQRPKRRLALLLTLEKVGRTQGLGLHFGELSFRGDGARIARGGTDVAGAGGILRPAGVSGRQERRRRPARGGGGRRIDLLVVGGRALGLGQHAPLRVRRGVRDHLDGPAEVLAVVGERLDQAQASAEEDHRHARALALDTLEELEGGAAGEGGGRAIERLEDQGREAQETGGVGGLGLVAWRRGLGGRRTRGFHEAERRHVAPYSVFVDLDLVRSEVTDRRSLLVPHHEVEQDERRIRAEGRGPALGQRFLGDHGRGAEQGWQDRRCRESRRPPERGNPHERAQDSPPAAGR